MQWVIQSHPTSDAPAMLARACARAGVPVLVGDWRDEVLPDLPTAPPVILHGSCAFIENAWKADRWRPGARFSGAGFDCRRYHHYYGPELLNAGGCVVRLAEAESRFPGEARLFLRSCGDQKELTGAVWRREQLQRYLQKLREAGDVQRLDLDVLVAPRQVIDREWRLFIVEGRVVAGSQYRHFGELCCDRRLPPEVCRYAEVRSLEYRPAPVFVMDVAFLGDQLRVVELNGFHSSGFYASDVEAIVCAVERWWAAGGE